MKLQKINDLNQLYELKYPYHRILSRQTDPLVPWKDLYLLLESQRQIIVQNGKPVCTI